MPVLICLRKELWTGLISVGDQVPTYPVFTRAKIKSRLGILINFPVTRVWKVLSVSKFIYRSVGEGATSFPGMLHFTLDPHLIVLSKAASSTIFRIFGMTRPGPLVNTLPTRFNINYTILDADFWHKFVWLAGWFHGISTSVGYLMPNRLYTYLY